MSAYQVVPSGASSGDLQSVRGKCATEMLVKKKVIRDGGGRLGWKDPHPPIAPGIALDSVPFLERGARMCTNDSERPCNRAPKQTTRKGRATRRCGSIAPLRSLQTYQPDHRDVEDVLAERP